MGRIEYLMHSKKSELFVFVGIDGSGKTSQAKALVSYFLSKKQKVRYVWLRSPSYCSLPLMAISRLLGFTKTKTLQGGVRYSERHFERRPIRLVWPWLKLLDTSLAYVIKIRLPLLQGYDIVCDRFVVDTLVDVMVETDDWTLYRHISGHLLLSLEKKASLIFCLLASPSELLRRKKDIPSVTYLLRRNALYDRVANDQHIVILDANRPFEDVHKEIISIILSAYCC